ncbi:MAG: hypothetical protein G01um101424_301 [Parcubacteria group bacterium Gr01-1014_24]|nr:MAG: hypothetical protein G01um101424_301 [Parcubacteria group bacterium Gr01-1014_24]
MGLPPKARLSVVLEILAVLLALVTAGVVVEHQHQVLFWCLIGLSVVLLALAIILIDRDCPAAERASRIMSSDPDCYDDHGRPV